MNFTKMVVTALTLGVALFVYMYGASRHSGGTVTLTPPAAKLTSLPQVAKWLGEENGLDARPYSTYDFGRGHDEANLSVVVPMEQAEAMLDVARDAIAPPVLAFIGCGDWFGVQQTGGVELVFGEGMDQFDILRMARSDAINYNMETEDLITKLKEYDERFGIDITHAVTDTIIFRLKHMPEDMTGFANDLYKFCPDIVDQGTQTVGALATEIRGSRTAFLWWD